MAYFSQNWRIYGALLLATVLVVGAYFAALGTTHPPIAEASTETALLQAIATKDTDGDGLPDWEESLYGTDPNIVDTRGLGMTDGEAVAKGLIVPKAVSDVPQATSTPSGVITAIDGVPAPTPGSLTDTFSKNFFTLYINAKQANNGAALTEQQTNDIAQQAVNQLTSAIAPSSNFKSVGDLTVSGTGAEALKTFATDAENVLGAQQNHEKKSELAFLGDFLNNQDASALTHIHIIATSYLNAARGIAALSVPQEMATADLALVNAMEHMGEICNDLQKVDTDPIASMLALLQYSQTVLDLGNAFIDINKTYLTAGVILAPGTPGAAFVNLIPNVAAKQKTQP